MNNIYKKILLTLAIFALIILFSPVTRSLAATGLSKCTVTLSKTKYEYTGKACKPKVTVKYKRMKLVLGTDYTVKYSANTKPGTATVTVKGKGAYSGSLKKTFKIVNGLTVKLSKKTYTYTGEAIKPKLTASLGSKKLTTANYSVTYKNNKKVGTGEITVTGKGKYKGKKAYVTFFIVGEDSAKTGLYLEKTEGYLCEGERYKIEVKNSAGTVSYKSADVNITEVDNQGEILARCTGSTVITVSDGKKTATLKVTVIRPDYIPLSMNLNPGEIRQAQVTGLDEAIEYKWSSDDTSIATVDKNGNVTGVQGKGGKTNVRVTFETLNGEMKFKGIEVNVGGNSSTYDVEITNSKYKKASGVVSNSFAEGQRAEISLLESPLTGAYADGSKFWHNGGLSTVYLDGYNYYFATDSWNNRVLVYKVPEKDTWGEKNHSLTKYLYCILGQKSVSESSAGPDLDQLNWPRNAEAALVNGQLKVYVSDTNNNRILVWENLLEIEEKASANYGKYYGPKASYSLVQKFDTSKIDFEDSKYDRTRIINEPESGIHWPWAVWTDGKRLMVTSTTDGYLLIWDQLPSTSDKFPDRVIYTGGTVRTIACQNNYVILGDHNIETKEGGVVAGARVIEDYEKLTYMSVKDNSGELFKYSQPVYDEKGYYYIVMGAYPCGVFLQKPLKLDDGTTLPTGTLLLQETGSIAVYTNGKLPEKNRTPKYYVGGGVFEETRLFRHTVGEYASLVIDHNGNFYITEGARGNYVGYKNGTFPAEPYQPTKEEIGQQDGSVFTLQDGYYENIPGAGFKKFCTEFPNLCIGSENCTDNEYKLTYRYQNCMADSDGKYLAVSTDSAGMGSALLLWKNIPDESGAVPDIIYQFQVLENLNDLELYNDGQKTMLLTGGLNSVFIWNDIETALAGKEPNHILRQKIGTVTVNGIWSLAYDGEYFYLCDNNGIYIFKGIPEDGQAPVSKLDYHQAKINVCKCNDGETYICISQIGQPVIYKRENALKNGEKIILKGSVRVFAGGLDGKTLDGKRIYEKSSFNNNTGANDLLVTKEGKVILTDGFYRLIIWDSIEEAVKEGETNEVSSSRIVIGYGEDLYDLYDVLAADPTNKYFQIGGDPVSVESPTTLFRPFDIAYDGNYLWVSDFKFSGGIKRFSGK